MPDDPIPELKRQLLAEPQPILSALNPSDMSAWLKTDRSRLADLRNGKLERFSLEALIRFLALVNHAVELRVIPPPRPSIWLIHRPK